jgi:hypothetical protein
VHPLRCLLRELLESPLPAAAASEVAAAAERLEREVEPAARNALGMRAADFMRLRWSELAQAAGANSYEAHLPQVHHAALYLRADRPDAAAEAATTIADWESNADALTWRALGCCRAGQLAESTRAVMRLALVAPARLTHTLDRIGDAKLARDFAAFEAQCDWLASEDETAAGWFPAWYLIEYPGAELGLERGSVPDTPSARAAGQLTRLLALERRGYSPELVSARRDLQALAPGLFELYMARRQVAHR